MVQFGKKLMTLRNPKWESYYLNYKDLKKTLKKIVADSKHASPKSKESFEENFKQNLDSEIEKIVLFYLEKQGEFAGKLLELRNFNTALDRSDLTAIQQLIDRYRNVGDEIVRLLHYAELNATGLRKILKKHDKHVKDSVITGTYLTSRVDDPYSHLQPLYHFEGVEAIVGSIRYGLETLRKLEHELNSINNSSNEPPPLFRSISEVEPVLGKIAAARRRLQQSMTYVKTVAMQSLIFDMDISEDEEENAGYESLKVARNVSPISRLLNHLNTFFYMMNYYIVAPTSGDYAILLGGNAALSGAIIGMTPIAALVSAILYSWWANKSYKNPLIFSTWFLIVGNLLYAIALSYNAIWMVLAGRLLTGFGGARAINRRYIADSYSRDERTAASALFVTAGALGMSAGPALAAALDSIPDYKIAGLYFTVETAPGWFMFVTWIGYLFVTIFWFVEPDRPARNNTQKSVATNETMHLLEKAQPTTSIAKKGLSNFRALLHNVPVLTTLFIYFVLKLILECLLSSSATVTSSYFGWSSTTTGVYLAVLGLLMFPANVAVSYLSRRYEDRELIVMAEILMLIGSVGIISYSSEYRMWQYIFFGVVLYVSSNVLEGVNMSLLSTTLPKSLARGTFNSGLLATEAGTFGRAVGDNLVTIVGLKSISNMLNYTFIPLAVLVFVVIIISWRVYDDLVPSEENE